VPRLKTIKNHLQIVNRPYRLQHRSSCFVCGLFFSPLKIEIFTNNSNKKLFKNIKVVFDNVFRIFYFFYFFIVFWLKKCFDVA
jgi:hypothetical protein